MKKEILVSVDQDDVRVVILEDGEIVELYMERPLSQRFVGNIYLGKVENVLPGMEACFVDLGLERNAFLYVDDAYPVRPAEEDNLPKNAKRAAINKLVRPGQEVMVQIVKDPVGKKGARITRNVTLPGRYLVLMPAVDYVGVSRRIGDDKERGRLKRIARDIKPADCGLIVRTVAEGAEEDDIKRDLDFLLRQWRDIQRKSQKAKAPALLHRDMGVIYQVLRDNLDKTVEQITVDDQTEYQRILQLVDVMAPGTRKRVKWFRGERGILEERDLEEELEKVLGRRVWLDCGGHIVIDRTEALTVIDVNTGRYVGKKDLEETVYRTNLEAAEEIGRQLRLRDIGGIIVIDFIDMESPKHRDNVVEALEKALARDKTRATVLGITHLGLVEMTRKKGRQSLDEYMLKPCPYCGGTGRVMSELTMSRKVRNDIREALRNSEAEALLVEVHPSVAAVLIGAGGSNLRKLESELGKSVYVRGSETMHLEDMDVVAMGDKREVEDKALPVKPGDVIRVTVEEPHASNPRDGIARIEGYVLDIDSAGNSVGQEVEVEIVKAYRTYAKARVI
ncbi:MAG: Rne/Rng family ribonuclease [Clostridia bacterium]